MAQEAASLDTLLDGIRAAADPSRLRLLAICSQGEWTVSELVQILGQSQPRISRHLKILAEAGLLDRFREGSLGVLPAGPDRRRCASGPFALPPVAGRRRRRCASTSGGSRRCARRGVGRPQRFFDERAGAWDSERDLAVDGSVVEARLRDLFAAERPASLLDIGTGTGRILQVLAGHVGFGLGIDLSHDMLAVARANLDQREARNCQVRHGDMYQLPLPDGSFGAVDAASGAALRRRPVRRPGRGQPACSRPAAGWWSSIWRRTAWSGCARAAGHRRLGFSDEEIGRWFRSLGLVAEPPRRLAGPELTVVIWTARRPRRRDRRHQRISPGGTPHDAGHGRPPPRADPSVDGGAAAAGRAVDRGIPAEEPRGGGPAVGQRRAVRRRSGRASSRSPAAPAAPATTARCRWSARIQDSFGVPVAAHMTCAWSSRAEIDELARDYWRRGVRRIVALRGDPPKGSDRYRPRADGYAYAADLIAGLKAVADFEISAGCYPEVHPEAASAEADLENLRRKVEAGATRLVTQYCFDTDRILRFRDLLVAAGIEAEYVPGIMPIHNFTQIKRFSQGCGAGIPAWLERLFDGRRGKLADARHDRRQRRQRAVPPARRRGPDPDARLCAEPGRAAAGHPPPAGRPRDAGRRLSGTRS